MKSISFSTNYPLIANSRGKKKKGIDGNQCSSPPLNIALPCALWFQLQIETSGTHRNARLPKIWLEWQQYHYTCSDLLGNWPQPDMCSFLGASPALRREALPAAGRQQHRRGSGFGGSWFCTGTEKWGHTKSTHITWMALEILTTPSSSHKQAYL